MDANSTFASTRPVKTSTKSPVPWWVGFVVAGACLIVAVVMAILLVKKTSSSPPSDGPLQCGTDTCPDGTCNAGQCRYQCNEDNCPTTCKDNVCQNPPPPTDICTPGGDIPGICNDGTCSSDCSKCDRSTCGDTCKDTQGRLVWNENNNQQCILKYDWSGIDCPANCSGTTSTKLYGIQCPVGFLNQDGTSDHIPPTGAKCYGEWKTFGSEDNARTICQGPNNDSGWHFNYLGTGPYMCGKH